MTERAGALAIRESIRTTTARTSRTSASSSSSRATGYLAHGSSTQTLQTHAIAPVSEDAEAEADADAATTTKANGANGGNGTGAGSGRPRTQSTDFYKSGKRGFKSV